MNELPERRGVDAAALRDEIIPAFRPCVLRGLVEDWPAVAAGRTSPRALADYVKRFDRGAQAEVFVGPPAIKGRFFYQDDMTAFNFERRPGRVGETLDLLIDLAGETEPPSVYMGATAIPDALPGFETANPMALLDPRVAPRLWIGNATVVSAHYDLSDNIACVVGGRRRFTLFPPEQAANLYVGPIDHTIAGQSASLVALDDPDLERFSRFAQAQAAGMTAELEPGDAIYIPSLWWHGVRALEPVNMLVNYWWEDAAGGAPFDALVHGLMAISALPPARREAWRALFDHYVFQTGGDPAAHLQPEHRGVLGTLTPALRNRIKAFLVRALSRP